MALYTPQAVMTGLTTQVQLAPGIKGITRNGCAVRSDPANNATGCIIGDQNINNTGAGAGIGYKFLPGEIAPIPAGVRIDSIYGLGTSGDILYLVTGD